MRTAVLTALSPKPKKKEQARARGRLRSTYRVSTATLCMVASSSPPGFEHVANHVEVDQEIADGVRKHAHHHDPAQDCKFDCGLSSSKQAGRQAASQALVIRRTSLCHERQPVGPWSCHQ